MYKNRKVIGICTAELDQKYHVKLLRRVMKELAAKGYYILVFGSDSDLFYMTESDFGDASIFELLNFELLDNVVIFSETIKQKSILENIVNRAHSAGVPVVSVGKEMEECYSVVYDTESAFETLVRHVIEYHGARAVNFVGGLKENEIAQRRLEIYKKVLDDNDILFEEERVGYGDFWDEPTYRVMDEFMQPTKIPPEAIICANDSMAIAVCDYLKEHDIMVPDEIMVTGIDGIDEGIQHFPGITTCVRDEINDAKRIAEVVECLCNGKKALKLTILEYHMRLSQSCGCQMHHLFDQDALVAALNADIAQYRSDVRRYAEMSEKFLECRDDAVFKKLLSEYMPDNSFICINSDLGIESHEKKQHSYQSDVFTESMKALVKRDGKVVVSDCLKGNIIPKAGEEVVHSEPVIMMPIHYGEKVVGYMGLWQDLSQKIELNHIIHFLLSFNNSAGLRLT